MEIAATAVLLPGEAGDVPMGVTLLFTALLVGMILCLALEEKLHAKKSVITGVFAVVSLLLGAHFELLPFDKFMIDGHAVNLPVYVPEIDWNVIAIILGSSLFVDVTSKSGLFTWIAIRLTKASRGDPVRLLVSYGVLTVVFSAVLNNVTAMIIVGSLTSVSLDKLGRKDHLLGFLLIEALLTNVGGLLTLISSVPNILIGTEAGISFVGFFVAASPYVVIATAATLWLGAKLFRISGLRDPAEREEAVRLVSAFDENDGVESRFFFWFSAVMLVAFIGVIATTSVLPWIRDLGMGYVALSFGLIMLVRYKAIADRFYSALDWDLLAFFAALFIVIHVMGDAQVLALIGAGLSQIMALGETSGTGLVLISSALTSSVTDNIPLAAVLAKILGADPAIAANPESPFWWAVIFGTNLGGNITPIGSASTLVAVTIIHKHEIKLGFGEFVRAAVPFAGMQIALAVVYVLVFF